ncbi:uncharacterized protein LOC136087801 [Hydra vulgaris]|uniref:Uncharacterized protein LOC136087801 n=1 Tax=Hydra vulgaris TaxID=6087 RepID=A0ABM4CZK2_HYDVU
MATKQNAQLGVLIGLLRIHPEYLSTFVNSSNKDEFNNSFNSESFISQEEVSPCRVVPNVASCSKSFSTELSLSEIRKYPCLLDVSHPTYKDRNIKINAWKEMSACFEAEIDVFQKKTEKLKRYFEKM